VTRAHLSSGLSTEHRSRRLASSSVVGLGLAFSSVASRKAAVFMRVWIF